MSSYAGFKPTGATAMPNMGQTEAEIAAAVAAEIEAEIGQQVSPLNDLIGQYQQGQTGALQRLDQLYGSIMPSVQNATTNLRSNFDQTIGFERGIVDATQARLAGIRQQAGAQAQALAQQLGVPIPVSLFDMGALTEQGIGAAQGAGSLLTAQGMRDSALAEAEAFSGRVFPLMRKEQEEDTRRHYTTQIESAQKEIAQLKKMKPGLISERTRQRLLEERGYQLERAKAQRDWELSKFSANLETKKLTEARNARLAADKLARNAQKLQSDADKRGNATTRRGQTLDAKARAAALKADQAAKKANNLEYEAKRELAIKENITKSIQAYLSGGTTKLKTVQKDPATGSYTEQVREMPTGEGLIQNPNQMLEAVRAAVPGAREMPKYLLQQVASAFRAQGIQVDKDWVEGEAIGKPTEKNTFSNAPTRKAMNGMALGQLDTWARRNMGFKGGYPKGVQGETPAAARKRKAWLINWIARMEVDAGGTKTYGPR